MRATRSSVINSAQGVEWSKTPGFQHTFMSANGGGWGLSFNNSKAPFNDVEFRRAMLDKHPRHRTVLDVAAKNAAWGAPLAAGKPGEKRARGVAVHESFGTVVA